jgi:hypothetical protein
MSWGRTWLDRKTRVAGLGGRDGGYQLMPMVCMKYRGANSLNRLRIDSRTLNRVAAVHAALEPERPSPSLGCFRCGQR